MDPHEPGWELYRAFLAVLQHGSLSGAARALGLTQPTLGRHVDALEQALGLPLFTRSQHGLAPTEAALELRPYAETLAATAAALLRVASGQGGQVRGTVRITASEVIGAEVLPSILARLRQAQPELVIELVLSNKTEDLLRRDADIAVRMHHPVQEALVARHLGTIELGLHAHPHYLAHCGRPASLDDLRSHTLVGFDQETGMTRRLRARGIPLHRGLFALRADSDLAQLAAIRAGFGIGVCQVALAQREPRLLRVLPGAFSFQLDTWLAMHEDLRASPRCRATFDALAAGLSDYIASASQVSGLG
ncbi:MAG TPA: LysR family transcriptional regulator [Acetobacteraceae bacterium]|nr:LysR family transcriptional regulator [Acetobacteraceae bacterium]